MTEFQSLTGLGVLGKVDGRPVALGNAPLLAHLGVPGDPAQAQADQLRADGQTVVFVVVDGQLAGFIGVADPLKPSAAPTTVALRTAGWW